MKISYSNYSILEKLQKGLLNQEDWHDSLRQGISDEDFENLTDWMCLHWHDNAPFFLKEIDYICDSFREATEKSEEKLGEVSVAMMEAGTFEKEISGTFIESGGLTLMFRLRYDESVKKFDYTLYCFHKNKLVAFHILPDDRKSFVMVSEDYNEKDPELNEQFCMNTISRIILYYYFKKYADVDVKLIPPNTRIKTATNKYVNDTKLPITYLDSKWFTTLVKSGAFKVKGHLRFQPFGTGLHEKKLIWIDEYTKTGYTAPARILSNKDQ